MSTAKLYTPEGKPQEVWDLITDDLPSLSAKYAACTLGFRLGPEKEKHGNIWGLIFQDLAWIVKVTSFSRLDPILLGASIASFWEDEQPSTVFSRASPWVFLIGSANAAFDKDRELFLQCLQPHTYIGTTHEVHFLSGLVLNVSDVVSESSEVMTLQPRRLFVRQNMGSGLVSYYVYWNNGPKIYTLQCEKIFGFGGVARDFAQIVRSCRCTIDGNGERNTYQFCEPTAQSYVRKIFDERRIRGAMVDRPSAAYGIDYLLRSHDRMLVGDEPIVEAFHLDKSDNESAQLSSFERTIIL